MKRVKSGYIPAWWGTVQLPARAYRVGIILWTYADSFGHCWPGGRALARETKLDRREVFRALDDLVVAGLLSIKPGDSGHTNHYWLSLLPGEIALKTREKRKEGVVVQDPLGVVGLHPERGGGSGTPVTPIELPSITTRDVKTQPGDDFLAIARKRWPERFVETEDKSQAKAG